MKDRTEKAMVIAIIALVLITAGMIAIAKLSTDNDAPTSTITCALEPIATPTLRPSETPEPTATPEPTETPNKYSKEIEDLARVCDAEASVCDEIGRRAVIDTVLNRVSSGQFRNTIIEECHFGEFRYSDRDRDEIDQKIFDYAEEELIKWINKEDLVLPSDYFYFWGNHGVDENGNPTEWKNYFYNDYELWKNEAHKIPYNAFVFEDDNI